MAGQAPAEVVYADERIVAFKAPEPEAPTHLILVPRLHIPSVDALRAEHRDLWMELLLVAQALARSSGVDVDRVGYELLTHAGRHDTRSFPHLHILLLSGRQGTT